MKKLLTLTLILVLALAALSGCVPKVFVDSDGNRVEVKGDTISVKGEDGEANISVGSNLSWPKDKMGGLPELNGKISSVIDTPQGVAVTVDGVSKSDYDSYVSKIKGQGYESVTEVEMEGMVMFAGKKDDNGVNIQLHLDSDGKGSCIIIYGAD